MSDQKPHAEWVKGSGRVTPDELADKIKRTPFPTEVTMGKILFVALGNSQIRTPVRTGTLRRSETTRMEADGERGYLGTNIKYGPFVHYGTKYMAARPFFEEGIEDSRSRILDILADVGGDFLEDVSKG